MRHALHQRTYTSQFASPVEFTQSNITVGQRAVARGGLTLGQRQQRNGLLSERPVRVPEQLPARSVGKSPTERIEPENTVQSPPQVKQMLQAHGRLVVGGTLAACRQGAWWPPWPGRATAALRRALPR